MKKTTKKLELSKETLRDLDKADDLKQVLAAGVTSHHTACSRCCVEW